MFNAFERAVAGRYLRARRGERFVSVIAGFSLIGIALGVATLIIVMSVMGGFKVDLLGRILGFNGHLGVYGQGAPLTEYDDLAARTARIPGVQSAIPVVDGQALLTDQRGTSVGGIVRGIEPQACASCARSASISSAARSTHYRATTRSRSASASRGDSASASGTN